MSPWQYQYLNQTHKTVLTPSTSSWMFTEVVTTTTKLRHTSTPPSWPGTPTKTTMAFDSIWPIKPSHSGCRHLITTTHTDNSRGSVCLRSCQLVPLNLLWGNVIPLRLSILALTVVRGFSPIVAPVVMNPWICHLLHHLLKPLEQLVLLSGSRNMPQKESN